MSLQNLSASRCVWIDSLFNSGHSMRFMKQITSDAGKYDPMFGFIAIASILVEYERRAPTIARRYFRLRC